MNKPAKQNPQSNHSRALVESGLGFHFPAALRAIFSSVILPGERVSDLPGQSAAHEPVAGVPDSVPSDPCAELASQQKEDADGPKIFISMSSHTPDNDHPIDHLCAFLRAAALEDLQRPPTREEVKKFLLEAAATPLSEKEQAKLDAMPVQLPHAKEWLAAYHKENMVLSQPVPAEPPTRFESDLRTAMPWGDVDCLEREPEIEKVFTLLDRSEHSVLILCGEQGIGKTTLAQAVAQRFTQRGTIVPASESAPPFCYAPMPSNVRFFDCVGLSHPAELSSLLLAQGTDLSPTMLPETVGDCLDVLGSRLAARPGEPGCVLWVLDGLDECLRAAQDDPIHESCMSRLMKACARMPDELKIVITARAPVASATLHRLFGESQPEVQRIGLLRTPLPVNFSLDCLKPAKQEIDPFQYHPLAARLIEAAFTQCEQKPVQRCMALFDDAASLLDDACQCAWDGLLEREMDALRLCQQLPAGVRCLDGDGTVARYDARVRWGELFQNRDWREILTRLRSLGWLTEQKDYSDPLGRGCIYRLHTALNTFVAARTPPAQADRIRHRLVYFWARHLKLWSRAAARRLTESAEPCLPAKTDRHTYRLKEESARYLIDFNRLNWQHAYDKISTHASARDIVTLHCIYLRGAICHGRPTGVLNLFEHMAQNGIEVLKDLQASILHTKNLPPWRQNAQKVYLASCHGLLGRARRRLRKWAEAKESLQRAAELLVLMPPESLRSRHELAWVLTELGQVHQASGSWQEAEVYLRKAMNLREELVYHFEQGDKTGAAPQYDGQLERRRFQATRCLASSLNACGNLLNERFAYVEAEVLHRRALEIHLKAEGTRSPYLQQYLAHCRNDLGNSLYYRGQFHTALAEYKQALKIREAMVTHPESEWSQYVARTCNNVGNTLRKLGRWSEAQPYLERAVSIQRLCAREYPIRFNGILARTLTNSGRVYYHQGLLREARRALEEADRTHSAAARGMAAPFHWVETCNFLSMVYLCFDAINHADLALQRAEKLLEQSEKVCPLNHAWYRAFTLNTRARFLLHSPFRSDWEQAERMLRECEELRLSLNEKINAPGVLSLHFAQHWHDLGLTLRQLGGRNDEACAFFTDSLNLRRQIARENPRYVLRLVARSATQLADIHEEEGRSLEAQSLYKEAKLILLKLTQGNPQGFKDELHVVNEALKQSVQATAQSNPIDIEGIAGLCFD